ncbi:heptosyltransferase [Thermotomaculum hydrothermale]|uniref:Heptosyltransferase n=1 Tax=Thermotomaculum hydrothermale TaxID=981385 RepID=A0A7R6SZ83_9BACT|nr:heptosyltransferase [Thermotomaculum hydrothermale]
MIENILGKKIEKILVCRLSAIGDVVRTVPSVAALRKIFPDCKIDWLVEDRCAQIITGLEYIDNLKIVPRRKWKRLGLLSKIKGYFNFINSEIESEDYDLFVDFHGILKSGLYGYFAKIPVRLGYRKPIAKELNTLFTNYKIEKVEKKLSRYERNFLIPLHFDKNLKQEKAKLPIGEDNRKFAEEWLKENGLSEKEYAFIYPGTSAKGRYKRWMPENYGKLCDLIYRKLNLPCVIGWGPGEEEIVEKLVSSAKNRVYVLPLTTMKQLSAFIEKAKIFIGGDTGPMHISSLVNTPVVTIFGPSDPIINQPATFTPFKIVYANWHCSPCRNKKCKTLDCLKAISPEKVVEEIEKLLKKIDED